MDNNDTKFDFQIFSQIKALKPNTTLILCITDSKKQQNSSPFYSFKYSSVIYKVICSFIRTYI